MHILHILYYYAYSTNLAYIAYYAYLLYCNTFWLPASIDDEDPDFSDDDWFVIDKRLGQEVHVRADRWYQSDPSESMQEKVCPDIRCNTSGKGPRFDVI